MLMPLYRYQDTTLGHSTISVTLSRLNGNTHNIWEAIAVQDSSRLTVTSPQSRNVISSPVRITGTGSAFEATIGQALVLDHLYTDIGHATVSSDIGMGIGPYSTMVIYNSSFQSGTQEGVVEVQEANGGISLSVATGVMVKVLLTPGQHVALGPLPCPDTVQNASYWNPIVGTKNGVSNV